MYSFTTIQLCTYIYIYMANPKDTDKISIICGKYTHCMTLGFNKISFYRLKKNKNLCTYISVVHLKHTHPQYLKSKSQI